MRHPWRWLVTLGVLVLLFVVVDRVAAHFAAARIASVVQTNAHLSRTPSVDVHGFPFLTQAVSGTYDRIEVSATDIFDSSPGKGSVSTVNFEGVHIPPSKAISGDVHEIKVDHLVGTADVSFADLEAASHVPGVTVQPVAGHGDEAAVGESVTVAGVKVDVSVIAKVTLHDDAITLTAGNVNLPGGISLPSSVLDQVRSHAGFSLKVPGLPSGVHLTSVTVASDGVVVSVRGDDLVLTR